MAKSRKSGIWKLALGSVLALLMLSSFAVGGSSVTAQVTIDCAEFAVAAPASGASPAAEEMTAATAEREPVAFPAEGGDLTVFAAASLTDAFEQIGSDIEAAYPNVSITFNFAGSQALVTQLTEGAEADVFVSANLSQMNAASEAGVTGSEPATFARNQLVIVVPADNPAGIETPADLGNPDILFVTAQAEVPVGQYTRQSVCLMAADTATYGDDFTGRFASNIVSEEENVRAVVTKVSLGEADAGIVYSTDVTADIADSVIVIPIPTEVNIVAEYPVAAVSDGDPALAQAYIDYLLGPDGQATLVEFGFLPKP